MVKRKAQVIRRSLKTFSAKVACVQLHIRRAHLASKALWVQRLPLGNNARTPFGHVGANRRDGAGASHHMGFKYLHGIKTSRCKLARAMAYPWRSACRLVTNTGSRDIAQPVACPSISVACSLHTTRLEVARVEPDGRFAMGDGRYSTCIYMLVVIPDYRTNTDIATTPTISTQSE